MLDDDDEVITNGKGAIKESNKDPTLNNGNLMSMIKSDEDQDLIVNINKSANIFNKFMTAFQDDNTADGTNHKINGGSIESNPQLKINQTSNDLQLMQFKGDLQNLLNRNANLRNREISEDDDEEIILLTDESQDEEESKKKIHSKSIPNGSISGTTRRVFSTTDTDDEEYARKRPPKYAVVIISAKEREIAENHLSNTAVMEDPDETIHGYLSGRSSSNPLTGGQINASFSKSDLKCKHCDFTSILKDDLRKHVIYTHVSKSSHWNAIQPQTPPPTPLPPPKPSMAISNALASLEPIPPSQLDKMNKSNEGGLPIESLDVPIPIDPR